MAELVDIARRWQAAEPDNEDAHYYLCKQRLLCGEGESLLADLCDFWQRYPSTQADDLLLGWCRQHRPDFFPLAVMAVEARCMADAEYVPGESARTRLLWADILHSGRLSPLGRSFVDSLFYKRKAMAWANSRLSTRGTRNAAVGSVPDGGAGGAGSVSQRKALFSPADPAGGGAILSAGGADNAGIVI